MVVPMPLKSLINNSTTMTPEPKKKVESHRVKCFHRKHREDVKMCLLSTCATARPRKDTLVAKNHACMFKDEFRHPSNIRTLMQRMEAVFSKWVMMNNCFQKILFKW